MKILKENKQLNKVNDSLYKAIKEVNALIANEKDNDYLNALYELKDSLYKVKDKAKEINY